MKTWFRTLALALTTALTTAVHAQAPDDYPNKPIRLVVPFVAGADTDVTARVVANFLQTRLKQTVIVDNRPGGGGIVGTSNMLQSPADGYTLMFAAHAIGYLDKIISATPFVPLRDVRAIALVASSGYALVTHPDSPFKTMGEMVKYVQANPGKVNFATVGPFPVPEIADLQSKLKLQWAEVPFPGGAPALLAVMGKNAELYNSSPTQALPNVKAGKLVFLGYTEPQRHPMIPDVPTVSETVSPGFSARFSFYLFGRSGMPADVVRKLNAAILDMHKDPEARAKMQAFGYQLYPYDSDQAQREYENAARLTTEVYARLGIKPM